MRNFGTPDSGYNSSFSFSYSTPSLYHSPARQFSQPSPISLLEQCSQGTSQGLGPEILDLYDLPPSDDEDDEEDEEDAKEANGTSRLLSLYKAGAITAVVGDNNCWKIQCNRCEHWITTSIPKRTKLSSPGHFSALDSHQNGRKCLYSKNFIRAKTAPPEPILEPEIRD
jgi:hypothetical protein